MSDRSTVTLLGAGDIGPIVEPTDQFAELILPVLKEADLRFGQCERAYSVRASIPAPGGLHTSRHPREASVWKTAGMDVISMASNHTMDSGGDALLDTIELFRGLGKHCIGAGKDIADARAPAIVERKGIKIAFLGYCSVLPNGHEAGHNKAGCVPMRAHTYYQRGEDPIEEYQPGTPPRVYTIPQRDDLKALEDDIRQAKQQADAVVMSIHWGLHHIAKTIADYQPVVAHAAIDAGADLILGHHPHILKAIEVYKGKVCFYSLGNFMITGGGRLKDMALWDLCWQRMDPESLKPGSLFTFPADARKTMLAKAVFSKRGVERVSFIPAYLNLRAQPSAVRPGDPRFHEVLDYVEWISDRYPHAFRVEGNEVVIEA